MFNLYAPRTELRNKLGDFVFLPHAAHAPSGVKVAVRPLPFRAYPYLMPADFPGNEAARDVLREVYGREPYAIRMGGSVPEPARDTVQTPAAARDSEPVRRAAE